MCEGVTAEELLNPMQEAQEQPGSNQTMKFTYKRRLFASPNKVQELIVPASIRAVKVNRFSTGSLQVYCAVVRVRGHSSPGGALLKCTIKVVEAPAWLQLYAGPTMI